MRDIIESELRGPSVFRDESKLSYDFVPDDLPGREEEMAQLVRAFKPLLSGGGGQNALVTGPVGTGKTALSKRFAQDFRAAAKDRGVAIEWTDVNCRIRSTESAALLKVLTHFDERFPDRGFSNTEMLEILRKQLERRQAHLIVVLDEVDVLLKKSGSDLVYHLTRFNEEAARAAMGVSLIMVSQRDAREMLDEAARSSFKRGNTISLARYGQPQLLAIVRQRVGLAFHPGTVGEDVMELVADIAAGAGDARFAIELLHKAGQNADDDRRPRVEPEDARVAADASHPFVAGSKLSDLDRHKKLTLLAIARALKKGAAFVVTGDAEARYALACEEFGERPRAHTQFWTYLKELEGVGFLQLKRSGKGVLGTTTLISIPDIPAKLLEERTLEALRSK